MSVIQILDNADAAFRILGAGLPTVLSVTTIFADKPHRLNGRTSAQRFCVLTILPPVTALAVGLPAQRAIAQRFRAMTQLGHRFVQAATACRTADLRNFSALGVKQQPLTRPARLMVMRAAVSHSSIEIPAANTAIARCSAGFRSAHEILFIACPRDGFRLFFELLPYNYSHTVSDSLSVENDRLVTLHGLFRAVEPHKGIFLSPVALPCLNPSSHL